MRQLFLVTAAAVALLGFGLGQARAGKVEITGTHLCCNQCKNIAKGILGKIEGVSDVAVTTAIACTTKDEKATIAAAKALADAGFFGTVKDDGKEVKVDLPAPKAGDKVDSVTVKNVHVCCGQCKTALGKLFPDAKLEYGKANEVKAVELKINGKGLEKAAVLETLRKAGFNGTIE